MKNLPSKLKKVNWNDTYSNIAKLYTFHLI